MILEGYGVKLHRLTEEKIELLRRWRNDPKIQQYMGYREHEIDLTNYTFVLINEKLSIEEFRRVLEDNINKEVVHIDTTGNVEIGKNLVVDGKIIVNDASKIVDTSGNQVANKITLTLLDDGTYQLNIE